MSQAYIHPTAVVATSASIGEGTRIWMNVQVRENARIGRECIVGKDAYIDFEVVVGDKCKIQNGALLYHRVTLEEGVFVGPGAIFTNDRVPRALTVDGELAAAADWHAGHTLVERGVSIGAGAVLLTDLKIGAYAMIGAGSVVLHDVPPFTLVVGNPARVIGHVCKCGQRLAPSDDRRGAWVCARDALVYQENEEGELIPR